LFSSGFGRLGSVSVGAAVGEPFEIRAFSSAFDPPEASGNDSWDDLVVISVAVAIAGRAAEFAVASPCKMALVEKSRPRPRVVTSRHSGGRVTPGQQLLLIPVATFAIVIVVGVWVMYRSKPKKHRRRVHRERPASAVVVRPAPPKPNGCAQCGGSEFVWDAARRRWMCIACKE
jgi:hypothetical protein